MLIETGLGKDSKKFVRLPNRYYDIRLEKKNRQWGEVTPSSLLEHVSDVNNEL